MSHSELFDAHIKRTYRDHLNPPIGVLKHPFLSPGGAQYANALWDWDSWLSNVAVRQAANRYGASNEAIQQLEAAERGCILNFLDHTRMSGFMPVEILPDGPAWTIGRKPGAPEPSDSELLHQNPHKPCLAQHAAFVVAHQKESAWLKDSFAKIQLFLNYYRSHCYHTSGLYFFPCDVKIGVDNDPCTFGRPARSSASIYLNSLLYREFKAAASLAATFDQPQSETEFNRYADELAKAIQTHCWDERDGFFYSVDLNLEATNKLSDRWVFHSGAPRQWDGLIQRIGVWSGLLPVWAGIATPEQAQRVFKENLENPLTFAAEYGIRSLSKMEKMYSIRASSNPSNWLGPVWGVVNYFAFEAACRYGLSSSAKAIAEKTIRLFGQDLEQNECLHEYYDPDHGTPVMTPGFQNWNGLAANMLQWLETGEATQIF
ncbi:MGH1-like glycoside hydrolase domain-containing protein [Coraliomargarita sp. W4R72]